MFLKLRNSLPDLGGESFKRYTQRNNEYGILIQMENNVKGNILHVERD